MTVPLRNTGRRLTRSAALSLPLFCMLLGTSSTVHAGALAARTDAFLRKPLAARPTRGWSDVIVNLGGELTPSRRNRIRRWGGCVYRRLPLVQSVAVRLPTRRLARLAALPFVRHLSADVQVKKSDEFTVGSSGADVAFQQYDLTGEGVTVAVLDSGVHDSMDFTNTAAGGSRVIAAINFVTDSDTTRDKCGHGTHVAGIIAGNGASSTGTQYFRTFYGIAREANLVNIRVLDRQGQGAVSSVISGIQWAIDNRAQYNIRVLNLSLGHPVGESYSTDPLCQAVEQAWKAGMVVVCAAGNDGRKNSTQIVGIGNEGWGTVYGSIQCPGNDPRVITVGAMKATGGGRAYDRIASYSSRGPTRLDLVLKPDLVAPGNRVISVSANHGYLVSNHGSTNLLPLSEYSYTGATDLFSNRYLSLSGTSMAAPVVAGAAALMLQADPSLSPDAIKARLMISADKWDFADGTADACTFGAGYLNIPAALGCAQVPSRPVLSPTLLRDAAGRVNVDAQQILWEEAGVWGTGINSLQGIWGTQVIWGDYTLSSSQILWGESVWGDQIIWGESASAVDLSTIALQGEN